MSSIAADFRAVTRDRVIAFPHGHDRPLLCTREVLADYYRPYPNSEYCALWSSPLRYMDPPSDAQLSPSGRPWVVYAEYLQVDNDQPHRPTWCIPETASDPAWEIPPSAYKLSLSHWTPLSADWTLRGALQPVLDVIAKRHQPFVARLHIDEREIAQLRRVYSNPKEFDSALWRAHFAPINIGEKTCESCHGTGLVALETMRAENPCQRCPRRHDDKWRGIGIEPKWSLSIQASFGHHCAPRVHRSLLGGDISQYYLWGVNCNVDRETLRKLNVPHDVAARFLGSETDPAYNVTAEDIQTVIDALENEAKNTGGPTLYDGPRGEGDFVEPSVFDPKLARAMMKMQLFGYSNVKGVPDTGAFSAHAFVELLRKQAMGEPVNITPAEAEEIKRKWEEDYPTQAAALKRIADVLENGADVTITAGSRERTHLVRWEPAFSTAPRNLTNTMCASPGCLTQARPSGDLCETHYKAHLDNLAAHAIRGVGASAAVSQMRLTGVREKAGDETRHRRPRRRYGQLSELVGSPHRLGSVEDTHRSRTCVRFRSNRCESYLASSQFELA